MRRRRGILLAGLGVLLITGCASSPGVQPGATVADGWRRGPAQWLLLPDDHSRLEGIRTTAEMQQFLEVFWRRREPEHAAPSNLSLITFVERSEAADQLYSEGGVRGALTDRGRALILLGSPTFLRHDRRKVPGWSSAGGSTGERPSRTVSQETWIYDREQLDPRLIAITGNDPSSRVKLVFLEESRRIVLVEGDKLLDRAALALAGEEP